MGTNSNIDKGFQKSLSLENILYNFEGKKQQTLKGKNRSVLLLVSNL